ncbi:MAG: branched-chain amino acid aminotransferase [Spirochaetota bacterium]|nr:branched-chain amino acid aminotransferase [Spirochaetota bacterium]
MNRLKIKRADLDWENLPFGYIKTDYNVRYHYKDGKWSEGEITSDETINLHIADPCIHYAQQAFEGLKVFETVDGRIVAFRPMENAIRFQHSCNKISIPPVPLDIFIESIKWVVSENNRFIPPYETGATLYVRPLIIGIGPQVGLGPAKEYIFTVFVSPVGPYYKGGFKPVRALVVEEYDRTAPKGVGDCKVGGNYAAGLVGSEYGKARGYPIVLYLDPKEKKYIDEFSTSNFIAISEDRYLTPHSETILQSITNRSLATIAEDLGMSVEKRPIAIEEIDTFNEVGAVGTAAVITPISCIHYRGRDYDFPYDNDAGPVITRLYNRLTNIQRGEYEDRFGWLEEIEV